LINTVHFDFIVNHPSGIDFSLKQGADFSYVLTLKDPYGALIDLTGFSARMKAKPFAGSSTTHFSWTSGAGDIVLGGTDGTLTFAVAGATTATYSWNGVGYYDLELISGAGAIDRLMQGQIELNKEITD